MAPRSVEARNITLDQLLEQVEQDRATVHVLRDGRAIAEVRPVADPTSHWRLGPLEESLKPIISRSDALAPLDEEDWPSEARPDAAA